jgi:hypothetical protein
MINPGKITQKEAQNSGDVQIKGFCFPGKHHQTGILNKGYQ